VSDLRILWLCAVPALHSRGKQQGTLTCISAAWGTLGEPIHNHGDKPMHNHGEEHICLRARYIDVQFSCVGDVPPWGDLWPVFCILACFRSLRCSFRGSAVHQSRIDSLVQRCLPVFHRSAVHLTHIDSVAYLRHVDILSQRTKRMLSGQSSHAGCGCSDGCAPFCPPDSADAA
jgi:hypothetical protein